MTRSCDLEDFLAAARCARAVALAAARGEDAPDRAPEERWQHGTQFELAEGLQRVSNPVASLRRGNRIGDAQVAAAARYYADFAFGACGAHSEFGAGSGGGVDGYSIARIEALGRFRDVARALDAETVTTLGDLVLLEKSIRSTADGVGGAARTRATRKCVEALNALADHYAKQDGVRPAKKSAIRAVHVDPGSTDNPLVSQ